MMKATVAVFLAALASCSGSGSGDSHPLAWMAGRMYAEGSGSTGDHIALRVDFEPLNGETMAGTLFIDGSPGNGGVDLEYPARIYRDPDFAGFLIIEYSGFGRAIWSWVEVLEGGARLGPGLEGFGYFPEAPDLGLVRVNYMSVAFWE